MTPAPSRRQSREQDISPRRVACLRRRSDLINGLNNSSPHTYRRGWFLHLVISTPYIWQNGMISAQECRRPFLILQNTYSFNHFLSLSPPGSSLQWKPRWIPKSFLASG